jgi:MerR family copper efflux transcriptional regulator
MNIGEISKQTNLSAKSIRLYEEKGIISPLQRSESGYREFSQHHINELNLISRAKNAGFSLQECKEFAEMSRNPKRESRVVKLHAKTKLVEVDAKIAELLEMKAQLECWISACPGDSDSYCPIIDDLTKVVVS